MNTLTVKYFASVREALGISSEVVHSTAPTVAALRAELMQRSTVYAQALADGMGLRAAYQHALCEWDTPLDANASSHEIAFFPPVTGG